MDSFKFHDIKVEKSKHRKMQRLTTLFRFVELIVFLIILSKFSTQFAFSFNLSIDHFRAISLNLIKPRFVFLIGNAIVLALFLISGQFSAKNRTHDFYEEYVHKCRLNQHVYSGGKAKMGRSKSQNFVKAKVVPERRHELRRSMTERCQNSAVEGRSSSYKEDEMSGDEFRRTVEAFIARQQRCLREEEDESSTAVISL